MADSTFDSLPDALKTVRTRPLFFMKLQLSGMIHVGEAAGVTRRIGVVSGGTFSGDRVCGNVMNGGSDWQVQRKDGVLALDVRLTLETDDGAIITMTYQGLRHGPAAIIRKIENGEAASPADYYFRSNPLFATASTRYEWLNKIIAVGLGHRENGVPMYSVFEVL